MKCHKGTEAWIDSQDKPSKLRKMDMRWYVRSLYKAGSLMTAEKELSKYKLDVVGVEVIWDTGGTEPAEEYTFFYGKGMRIMN
jgi:hypothetical protein